MDESLPGEASRLDKEKIAKNEYRDWILSRPPFSYEHPEELEERLYQMEFRVYEGSDWIMSSLRELGPEYAHVLRKYERVLNQFQRSKSIYESQDHISNSPIFQNSGEHFKTLLESTEGNAIATFLRDHVLDLVDFLKDRREAFFRRQAAFFQQQMIALIVLQLKSPNETIRKAAAVLYEESEALMLAVKIFEKNKSYTHDDELLRHSGKLTMGHMYRVCIENMDRILKKFEEDVDHDEKIRLYHKMKINILRDLDHDSREDLTHLKEEDHLTPGIRFTGINTRDISLVRSLGWEGSLCTVYSSYPQVRQEVAILTKTDVDKLPSPMVKGIVGQKSGKRFRKAGPIDLIRFKLLHGELTDEQKVECTISKLHDRIDNILSLKYMRPKYDKNGNLLETKEQRQTRKIEETIQLIEVAYEVWEQVDPNTHERNDILTVCERLIVAASDECERLGFDVREDQDLLNRLVQADGELRSKIPKLKSGLI